MDPDELQAAVAAALDAELGPEPDQLVEERPEVVEPDDLNEAMGHLHRSTARFWLGG